MTYLPSNSRDEYFRTKVLTASPEQLHLLLFDGAVRFARQGRDALAEGNLERGCERILRAQQIVLELDSALRHDVQPELCQRTQQLYRFIHRQLVDANLRHDLAAADAAIELLEYQRQTWQMLIERLHGKKAAPAPCAAAGVGNVNLAV